MQRGETEDPGAQGGDQGSAGRIDGGKRSQAREDRFGWGRVPQGLEEGRERGRVAGRRIPHLDGGATGLRTHRAGYSPSPAADRRAWAR